jgi:hypothetical protein
MMGMNPNELRYEMQTIMEAMRKTAETERKGRWSMKMQVKSTLLDRVVMFWMWTRMMFRSMVA